VKGRDPRKKLGLFWPLNVIAVAFLSHNILSAQTDVAGVG